MNPMGPSNPKQVTYKTKTNPRQLSLVVKMPSADPQTLKSHNPHLTGGESPKQQQIQVVLFYARVAKGANSTHLYLGVAKHR